MCVSHSHKVHFCIVLFHLMSLPFVVFERPNLLTYSYMTREVSERGCGRLLMAKLRSLCYLLGYANDPNNFLIAVMIVFNVTKSR